MSWSLSVSNKSADELEEALEGASSTSREQSQESSEQVTAAIDAAIAIVESGAVGDKDKKFTVSLSGHSNAGHEPAAGMANDVINISVSQFS